MSGTFVTPLGFYPKTLAEIKQELETALVTAFGQAVDLDPTGPFGQLVGILSKRDADLWNLAQEIYTSRDPSQATGMALDAICAETGVKRLAASSSVAYCYFTGAAGTSIPLGSKVSTLLGTPLWSTSSLTALSESNAHALVLEPTAPANLKVYTMVVGAASVTYTANGTDTKATVSAALHGALVSALPTWSFALAGDRLYIGYATASLLSPPATSFACTHTNMTNISVTAQSIVVCDETGPTTAAAGELVQISTPISGWNSTYNVQPAVAGRNVETDDSLRIRRAQSFLVGKATEDAIRNGLLATLTGVASVSVFSNRTDAIVDGRNPKSFEVVVVGSSATNDEIAQAIWNYMPAGIEAVGGQSGTAVDGVGNTHTVNFSIPSPTYLWVKVQRTKYTEESYGGDQAIIDAVLAWSLSEYSLGKDVITQRICVPVYSVSGVQAVVIGVKTTPTTADDGLPYGTSVIPIASTHYAELAAIRISVVDL